MATDRNSKYFAIYNELKRDIHSGKYKAGSQLPTEAELTRRWEVSRPTASKALNALEKDGLVVRAAGSGSYVADLKEKGRRGLLGLIVPALGTSEIFEPICAKIASLSDAHGYSLLWGGSFQEGGRRGSSIEKLAAHYIESAVAGVFFAPVEFCREYASINHGVVALLAEAGIPLVLLDSDFVDFPQRSGHDLVGLDHFRAGYVVTAHLLDRGSRRVDFIKRPDSAASVSLRIRGWREALMDRGMVPQAEWMHEGDPEDPFFSQALATMPSLTDAVCQNDETAAALMKGLEAFQVAIPERLRIVGFDDVKYARHLRVPLSTIHQPCDAIASCAVELMTSRIAEPSCPPRTVSLLGGMVERESSGPDRRTVP